MKERFEIPEMEIVKFAVEDIITTSSGGTGMGGENEGEGTGNIPVIP